MAELQQGLLMRPSAEYHTQAAINLYKSPALKNLVTQATTGRHLQITGLDQTADGHITAVAVRLCEDDYPGWLALVDLDQLTLAPAPYQPPALTPEQIHGRLAAVIAFSQNAMEQPNHYLWGGTLGPNYDCSGLIQAAFASQDIRLPRDSYQQEAFTQPVPLSQLTAGDLIFFGRPRTNHVALYLGQGQYIHSSGQTQGRNGIGIDSLWDLGDSISDVYAQTVRGAGRVLRSYQPRLGDHQ